MLLVDALDEADPLEAHRRAVVGNKLLHWLAAHLAPTLPPHFRLVVTARPDAALGRAVPALERAFGPLWREEPRAFRLDAALAQSRLSRSSASRPIGESAGRNLLYDVVRTECSIDCPGGGASDGTLEGVYALFCVAFARCPAPSANARALLLAVLAAPEPLPLALLQHMGFYAARAELPSWGVLFFEAEHRVHLLHKSLADWLFLELRQNDGECAVRAWRGALYEGHAVLAAPLLLEILRCTALGVAAGEVRASDYALKYTARHLCAAIASDGGDGDGTMRLDAALAHWPFVQQAFAAGFGPALVQALGDLAARRALTPYAQEALSWLRNFCSDFEANAAQPFGLERATVRAAPVQTKKYLEAVARLRELQGGVGPKWLPAHAVLGRQDQNTWPQHTHMFKSHSALVSSVAVSHDGRFLATGSLDKTARLWDVASGTSVAMLEGHSDGVTSVAFSHDGRFLATGSRDNTARLWDVASGTSVAVVEGHSGRVSSVAFSHDGLFLATGLDD